MTYAEKIALLKQQFLVLASDAKTVKTGIDEFKEWNSIPKLITNFKTLYEFVTRCVLYMEVVAKELVALEADIKGQDKQDALIAALDSLIQLPAYLEFADNLILKALINCAVDKLNGILGHDWKTAHVLTVVRKGKDVLAYVEARMKDIAKLL